MVYSKVLHVIFPRNTLVEATSNSVFVREDSVPSVVVCISSHASLRTGDGMVYMVRLEEGDGDDWEDVDDDDEVNGDDGDVVMENDIAGGDASTQVQVYEDTLALMRGRKPVAVEVRWQCAHAMMEN